MSNLTYLRVPIGGHSGPRGLEPGMISGGWGYKQGSVSNAIREHKPAGLVVWCPWGNEPHKNLSLTAYNDADDGDQFRQVTYVDGFRSCVQDWCDALRKFGPDPSALVGIYIGIETDPAWTLADHADAWADALAPLDPETCYPILDDGGSLYGGYASAVFATIWNRGFKRCGYECPAVAGSPIRPRDLRWECFCSGWWWRTQQRNAQRTRFADIQHRKVIQMEAGYGAASDVESITAGGAVPCPDWYVGLPSAAPAPAEKA